VLPADNIGEMDAFELVQRFLETDFVESDNYLRRLEKISRYEHDQTKKPH